MALEKNKEVTSEVLVPPAQVAFWSTGVGKSLRAAIYLAISAALAGLVANIQDNPLLFGQLTPFINVALVFLKNAFDPNVKTI